MSPVSLPLTVDPDLGPYTAGSDFCDVEHPDIQLLARELIVDASSPRAAAVALFEWVRDQVLYFLGPWNTTASHTLHVREGSCTNKSNLLIALLRAAGIPAAYGVLRVDAQRYWGAVGPVVFTRHAGAVSTHIHAAAYLDGRWVRCDPSTDRRIAVKSQHYCEQNKLIEWDGRRDRTDVFRPEHVHANLGLHANVDELLAKPRRRSTQRLVDLINRYIRFIRDQPPSPDAESLMAAYILTDDYRQTLAYLAEYMRERGIDPHTASP
jgi:transglutaminase-like putative cysteine protease